MRLPELSGFGEALIRSSHRGCDAWATALEPAPITPTDFRMVSVVEWNDSCRRDEGKGMKRQAPFVLYR